MKEVLINNILTNIKKNYKYDEIKLLEIKYGLETIYLTITKTVVIYLISFILNMTLELSLLIIFYGILRLTGFGLHAKKSYQCWISSLIIFVCIPMAIKYLILPKIIICIVSPLLCGLILKYAPADTEKRPLVNKQKRKTYKIITFIEYVIYSVVIILVNNNLIINTLFFSMILEVIVILPIIYRVFKLPYNNYLYYKKKGV